MSSTNVGGLRFGLCTDQNLSWPTTVERWRHFEQLGFDSAWDCDHFQQPSRPHGPYFEGWTLLAGLAAQTDRIRIGVLVSCNTFRHPALLAKEAVTVDHITNGRLELGLGAGWYVPEHEQFGIDFPATRRNWSAASARQLRSSICLLRQEVTTYQRQYYQLTKAPFRPAPIQQPRPPLTLGAHGPKMLRIVAEYADAGTAHGSVDEMPSATRSSTNTVPRSVASRRRSSVRSTAGSTLLPADPWQSVDAFDQVVGSYREAGINEFIIDAPGEDQFPVLERVATDVLPRLRSSSASP